MRPPPRISFIVRLCLIMIAAAAWLGGPAHADGKATLRMVEGETTAQKIVSAIAVRVLRKTRYRATLVAMTDAEAAEALGSGAVHVHLSLPAETVAASQDAKWVSLGGLRGNKPDEPLLKIVSKSLKKKSPYAQKMFKRLVLTPETVGALAAEVDGGAAIDAVIGTWMTANRKIWKPWVAASKNWMKP